MRVYNFGGSGRNPTKLYQGMWLGDLDDNVGTNFARGAPYRIWKGKKYSKFGAIFDSF